MSDGADFDPTRPYVLSAFVYVERDGKLLVTKRQGGAGAGLWARPGGILEPGETVVKREGDQISLPGAVSSSGRAPDF